MKFPDFARVMWEDCLIDPREPIVLGFSGGPDSLALLHALAQEGNKLVVAHLDHGLRPESGGEADQAESVVAGYGYRFFTERADVAEFAKQYSMSIEEAARKLRYEFLFRIATEQGAQAVAVAHNADDQVETVLMHLLRGAGARGLRGMLVRSLPNPWSQAIPLVRPLLGIWRQEILEYCDVNGLKPVLDQSNLDTTYFRNRLRHQLLPDLEKLSPGVKRRLNQSADILAAESTIVDKLAEQAWKSCLGQRGEDYLQLNRSSVIEQPLALQRILIRRAAENLRPGLRDLDFAAVERALLHAKSPVPAPQDWIAGLFLLCEGDHFWVADWDADLPVDWPQAPENEIQIEIPGNFSLNHWHLELREERNLPGVRANTDPYQAWLDHKQLGYEVVLRRRRAGDRFQPLGLEGGSMKLADFMINEKMPKRARERWPLLCKGDEIVWVPGYQLAHPFRLHIESQQAVHLSLSRP